MTKNSPAVATDAHISIIGHITMQELLRYLTATEGANGFANRFLWVCVRRSKLLPEGGNGSLHGAYADRLRLAAEHGKQVGELKRTESAAAQWREAYPVLSADRPGLTGALLARAKAQVMRLACLYAVLDGSDVIDPEHLSAGMAVWKYAEDSVRCVFGDRLGDPLADDILDALRRAGSKGMTRNDIRGIAGTHKPETEINRALGLLSKFKLARNQTEPTGGRPVERWFTT